MVSSKLQMVDRNSLAVAGDAERPRGREPRGGCAKQSQFPPDYVDDNCFSHKGLRRNIRIMLAGKQSQFAGPIGLQPAGGRCAKQSQSVGARISTKCFSRKELGDIRRIGLRRKQSQFAGAGRISGFWERRSSTDAGTSVPRFRQPFCTGVDDDH